MSEKHGYAGKDLEAMSFAVNYHRWILSIFAPYLGKRVVEVGAGTGSFSELLIERPLNSLSLVEPSLEMYAQLRRRVAELNSSVSIKTYNDIFEQVAPQIRSTEKPDSIIYVNVLEHIADDTSELKIVNDALDKGGRVFIFVPALRWLHGSFDRQIHHFRRYTRSELEKKCDAAGFKVITARYFDLFGVLPWWVKYRLLQSNRMEPGAVRFYDQRVVPVAKRLEASIRPPLGKNVLLVAEKI
jgi:SAM-dependent methyltransferase